jgi:hypothetical protein
VLAQQGAGEKVNGEQRPQEVQLGCFVIEEGEAVIDPGESLVFVNGPGRLRLRTTTTLWGQEVSRPTDVSVAWKRNMFFNGREVQFYGGVAASQGEARLACQTIQFYLDRLVSLKQDPANVEPVKIEKLVCDKSCRIEDNERPGGRLRRYQRLDAPTFSVASPNGLMVAPGPGTLRLFQATRGPAATAAAPANRMRSRS